MKPELKELSFNPLMRMEEIIRYSSVYQSQPESLAVHICDTSMMAYIIANQLNSKYNEGINIGVLLEKCLIHDLDEVMTGDIPRNTKYSTPEVKNSIDQLQDKVLDTIKLYLDTEDIISKCKNAKKGKEGFILKISDLLNVARRALIEIVLNGNKRFLKVVEELGDHLSAFANKDMQKEGFSAESELWIKSLIENSRDTIKELHYSNISYIKEYSIIENVLAATAYQSGKLVNGKKPEKKQLLG